VPSWVRYTSGALFVFGLFGALKKRSHKGLQAGVILFLMTLLTLGLGVNTDGGQVDPISRALRDLAQTLAVVFPLLGGAIAAVSPSFVNNVAGKID
jgi:hypothetical protein